MNRTLPTAALMLMAASLAPTPAAALPGEGCLDTLTYDHLSCLVDITADAGGEGFAVLRFVEGVSLDCYYQGIPIATGQAVAIPTGPDGELVADVDCFPVDGAAPAAEASRRCVEVGASARASGQASATARSACQSLLASCSVSTGGPTVACTSVARGSSPDPWRCTLAASVRSGSASATCWVRYR
jgi:hypothetical protein